MFDALHAARAERRSREGTTYIEVVLRNGSDNEVAAGGLRMRGECTNGGENLYFSATNHWSIAPGAAVYLTALIPNDGLNHVDFVDYIAIDGTVHLIGDRLAIGWFFSELKRGTFGADVKA